RLTARIQETFGINPHCACQYDALKDLPIEALHGVFFDDQTVPNSLAQMGKSVLPIRIVDRARGSSVIVSPLGHVITAHHVFYDPETGKPRENIKLKYNDEMEFTVSEENLRYVSREGDLVILQIPELAQQKDLCFAQVRQTPISEGSELVDVGFPQTAMENIMKRFYTVGAVIAPHENPSENEQEDFAGLRKMGYNFERFIMSNCVNVHGASGGAIFDSDGRVVGINTAFADQAKIGLHSDLTSPGTDEKLRVVLQEIIATYHNG
ncbi:MAG TPA: serine protease, partial [bacterium]|nr:serine protease [bacterium]